MTFPAEYRAKLHSTNLIECLNSDIKRRRDFVNISLNGAAAVRLIGAVLLQQSYD